MNPTIIYELVRSQAARLDLIVGWMWNFRLLYLGCPKRGVQTVADTWPAQFGHCRKQGVPKRGDGDAGWPDA